MKGLGSGFRRPATALALSSLALLAASCGKEGKDDAERQPAEATREAADSAPARANQGPLSDAQMLAVLRAANSVDSAAATLADGRTQNESALAYAQGMMVDHGAMNQDVLGIAARIGTAPEENDVSRALAANGAALGTQLSGKTGAVFAHAYIENEIAFHQAVLDALDQRMLPGAQHAELRSLLQRTRGTVEAHLQKARAVQGGLPRLPSGTG